MRVNRLPKTVTRQRRGCDLNPGLSALESSNFSKLNSRQPSHPNNGLQCQNTTVYKSNVSLFKIYRMNTHSELIASHLLLSAVACSTALTAIDRYTLLAGCSAANPPHAAAAVN